MARRKVKAKSRRKSNTQVNLLGIAESALIANVITTGLFNTNLTQFVTGNTGSSKFGSDGSSVMSLPELLGVGSVKFGGNYGTGKSFTTQVKANFEASWFGMAQQLILIPVGFKVAKKLTNQPRRTANKMLKMTGLGVKV
tara:strand:- start:1818 stop:2237 length:420 start_codon:yes stop_codon:yes gene_type:complete